MYTTHCCHARWWSKFIWERLDSSIQVELGDNIVDTTCITLASIHAHKEVFDEKLGKLKDFKAKLYIDP